jgi:hypothetical protein
MALLVSADGPIRLGNAPVRVLLSSPLEAGTQQRALGKAVERGTVILRVSRLSARTQPGVTFRLYFGLREGAAPDADHAVGTINFFNVVPLAGGKARPDRPVDFDVTRQLRGVLGEGAAGLTVTVVPEGEVAPGSNPAIGRVELLEK